MSTQRSAFWFFVIVSLTCSLGAAPHDSAQDAFVPRSGINPVIGDESWAVRFGRAPDVGTTEHERIRVHLAYVEARLRQRVPHGLSASQRAGREGMLNALAQYRIAGEFPRNDRFATQQPRLMDDQSRLCAVGHLVALSEGVGLIEELRVAHEWDYLLDIGDPRLAGWAHEHGFTLEELAMIQPTYARERWEVPPKPIRPPLSRRELATVAATLLPHVESCAKRYGVARGTLVTVELDVPARTLPSYKIRVAGENEDFGACLKVAAERNLKDNFGAVEPGDKSERVVARFRA